LLALQNPKMIWQKIQPFLPVDPLLMKSLLALLLGACFFHIARKRLNCAAWRNDRFLNYVFFQLLLALVCLWFVLPIENPSYFSTGGFLYYCSWHHPQC